MTKTADKTMWGEGPWQSEPDEERWTDEVTGMECRILRQTSLGHLCGYVRVSEELTYEDDRLHDVEVHGGLTFDGSWDEDGDWWLGFDCAHLGDLSPYMNSYRRSYRDYETYKNFEYVRKETTRLAAQLNDLGMGRKHATQEAESRTDADE